jgi:uncharacterized membrane protein YheB (UPF0754 family)
MDVTDWSFVLFPAVGAVIGLVTNHLAIKMLFRPYAPVMIGRLRLPFTPGVIPAQRETIAANIAHTFEKQLFSGDEIHAAITGPTAHRVVDGKVSEFITQLGPLAAIAGGMRPLIVDKLLSGIEEMATELIASGGELDIGRKIEDRINGMEIATLEELILGFSRKQFRHITFFGGVLGALIGLVQAALSASLG